jgi:hypothetical protein
MGRTARWCVLLGFDQPMQAFSGGKLNAVGTAFSAIYRLDRLMPARSSRQFNLEHPLPRALPVKHIGRDQRRRSRAVTSKLRHYGLRLTGAHARLNGLLIRGEVDRVV